LTVLLWPQVQNYSLTKLRLILVGAMASAIQRFLAGAGTRPLPWHKGQSGNGLRRHQGCLRQDFLAVAVLVIAAPSTTAALA